MTSRNSVQADVAQQAFAKRMQDPLQALEDVRIEDEANCTISAGYGQSTSTDDALLRRTRQQQLRILVIGEFCQMLDECDLGAGLPDAIQVGKQRLSERWKHLSEELQQQLTAALDIALTSDEAHDRARAQVRNVLRAVLSEQDWEAISVAAATAIRMNFKQTIAKVEADLLV